MKIQRGTLSEMIKNESNKMVKQTSNVTKNAAISVHQSGKIILNDTDNRTIDVSPKSKHSEKFDENSKPLSKIDIIKKFDNKYAKTDESTKYSMQSQQRSPINDNQFDEKNDDEENAQTMNNDEIIDNNDCDNQLDGSASMINTINNNNHKNGHGMDSVNNGGTVPPKPLPRTSRNNSISSLSSDQGTLTCTDESGRPVAKPRSNTASYKVVQYIQLHKKKKNSKLSQDILLLVLLIFVFLFFNFLICIWIWVFHYLYLFL